MSTQTPQDFVKRSLSYHLHNGQEFVTRAQSACVLRQANQNSDTQDSFKQLQECGLLDFSELNRTGLRGKGAAKVVCELGLPTPDNINQAESGAGGVLVARLGSTEHWLLEDPLVANDEGFTQLTEQITRAANIYPLYCQHSHAWFAVTGKHLGPLMAKLCAVDLNPSAFAAGAVVQTSVARVNAIVISHRLQSTPVYYVLSDSSSSSYLWGALLDAMQEFGGQALGLAALSDAT